MALLGLCWFRYLAFTSTQYRISFLLFAIGLVIIAVGLAIYRRALAAKELNDPLAQLDKPEGLMLKEGDEKRQE